MQSIDYHQRILRKQRMYFLAANWSRISNREKVELQRLWKRNNVLWSRWTSSSKNSFRAFVRYHVNKAERIENGVFNQRVMYFLFFLFNKMTHYRIIYIDRYFVK